MREIASDLLCLLVSEASEELCVYLHVECYGYNGFVLKYSLRFDVAVAMYSAQSTVLKDCLNKDNELVLFNSSLVSVVYYC